MLFKMIKHLYNIGEVKLIYIRFRLCGFEEAKNRSEKEFSKFLIEQYEIYKDLKHDLRDNPEKRTTKNIELFVAYNSFFYNLEKAGTFWRSKYFWECIGAWNKILLTKDEVLYTH